MAVKQFPSKKNFNREQRFLKLSGYFLKSQVFFIYYFLNDLLKRDETFHFRQEQYATTISFKNC